MSRLILIIGRKSALHPALSAWLVMSMAGIPFRETITPDDEMPKDSLIPKDSIIRDSSILYHGRQIVWGSLGIAEYLAELFPEKNLWPRTVSAQTTARSLCNEFNARMNHLRERLSHRLHADPKCVGNDNWINDEVERIVFIVRECRRRFGRAGRYLFGKASIADAFIAPLVLFFGAHRISIDADTRLYVDALLSNHAIATWRESISSDPPTLTVSR